jgi:hypothetical protein
MSLRTLLWQVEYRVLGAAAKHAVEEYDDSIDARMFPVLTSAVAAAIGYATASASTLAGALIAGIGLIATGWLAVVSILASTMYLADWPTGVTA